MGILTESRNTPTVPDHSCNRCYYQMQAYVQIRAVNIAVTVVSSPFSQWQLKGRI